MMCQRLKTGWFMKIVATVLCLIAMPLGYASAAGKLAPAGSKQGPEIFVQLGHTNSIQGMVFSSDGKYIISHASLEKTFKLWDVQTGREIRTFSGHQSDVDSVAISPDGKFAVSSNYENHILVWDIEKGTISKKIFVGKMKEEGWPHYVAMSPDGKGVAVSCINGDNYVIRIYDLRTGKVLRETNGHKDDISSIAFSPDGKYVVFKNGWDEDDSKHNYFRVWNVNAGKETRKFNGHQKRVISVVFSPDGKYLASGSADQNIILWHSASGKEIRNISSIEKNYALAFSPDGSKLMSSHSGSMKLWDVETGQLIQEFVDKRIGGRQITFSPDGRNVAVDGYNAFMLLNIVEGKIIRTFGGDVEVIDKTYFVFDDKKIRVLFSLPIKTVLKEYDLYSGRLILTNSDIGFDHNKHFYISDKKVMDLKTDRLIASNLPESFNSVTYSLDGKYALYAETNGKTGILKDMSTGNKLRELEGHTNTVFTWGFTPDSKYAVTGGYDSTVKLWNPATGKEVRTFQCHNYISFLPYINEKYLITGDASGEIIIWDINSGRKIRNFKRHAVGIRSIDLSADGKRVLSGDFAGNVKLWDFASGKEILTLKGHMNLINSAVFSDDGRQVLSASQDGTTRLWNVATGKEIAQFVSFTDSEWIVITPEGYFNASTGGAKHLNVRVGNQVYSIDNFYEKFYNPVYVASVLQGKKMEAVADIRKGILTPPDVRITSPAPGSQFNKDSITVTVAARDTGGGIDEIRLYHNGKAIGDDTRAVKIVSRGSEAIREFTVSLVDGVNTFRAVGFSKDRTESNPYELSVKLAAPSKDVSLYVFAVGINKYKNPALNLNYAEPDAQGIANFFKSQGKGLFKNVYIKEIYNEQATKGSIISQLSQLQNINTQDAVLIYLAGHGENIYDKWYFIPHELTYPEREADVKAKGISSDELSGYMKNIKAQKILMLIDACKSGAVLVAFRGFEDRKALSQLSRSTGVHIVAASTKDQFAAEVKELGHGVFTYTLLEGLGGKAAAPRESVTVRKLMGYVEDKLPEITKKYKQEAQYPVVDSRGMDFPLVMGR